MGPLESNLASNGVTTMPKALRDAIAVPYGGRLVWTLMPDGTMQVRLKCAYRQRRARSDSASTAGERRALA